MVEAYTLYDALQRFPIKTLKAVCNGWKDEYKETDFEELCEELKTLSPAPSEYYFLFETQKRYTEDGGTEYADMVSLVSRKAVEEAIQKCRKYHTVYRKVFDEFAHRLHRAERNPQINPDIFDKISPDIPMKKTEIFKVPLESLLGAEIVIDEQDKYRHANNVSAIIMELMYARNLAVPFAPDITPAWTSERQEYEKKLWNLQESWYAYADLLRLLFELKEKEVL